jgi:prepilin-type N-terminal cleavage/methylation domain-containing protein
MIRRHYTPRGFTLVEVLMALSLSAIVAVAVAHVVGVMHDAQKRVRNRGDRRALLGAIERRVVADLRGLVPPGGIYASGLVGENEQGAMGGEALLDPATVRDAISQTNPGEDAPPLEERDQLTLAVLPARLPFGEELADGEGSLLSVVYRIDDDPTTEERGLVRDVQRVRDLPPGVDLAPPEQIAKEVVAMDLAFFDAVNRTWSDVWDSGASDTLPTAVEVKLVIAYADEVFVYTILVAPGTGRPSAVMEAVE